MKGRSNTLSEIIDTYCPNCYTELTLNLAERRGDIPIVCPICSKKFSIKETEQFLHQLSPITEGKCPNCFKEIEFDIKDRDSKKLIICPVCNDKFYMKEVLPLESDEDDKTNLEEDSEFLNSEDIEVESDYVETNPLVSSQTGISKYVDFRGRATRKEYWSFYLITGFLNGVLYFLAFFSEVDFFIVLYGIFILLFIIPSISFAVRRLHDTGRNGGFVFLSLIPAVGAIILLIFLLEGSQKEDNEYGPYVG